MSACAVPQRSTLALPDVSPKMPTQGRLLVTRPIGPYFTAHGPNGTAKDTVPTHSSVYPPWWCWWSRAVKPRAPARRPFGVPAVFLSADRHGEPGRGWWHSDGLGTGKREGVVWTRRPPPPPLARGPIHGRGIRGPFCGPAFPLTPPHQSDPCQPDHSEQRLPEGGGDACLDGDGRGARRGIRTAHHTFWKRQRHHGRARL